MLIYLISWKSEVLNCFCLCSFIFCFFYIFLSHNRIVFLLWLFHIIWHYFLTQCLLLSFSKMTEDLFFCKFSSFFWMVYLPVFLKICFLGGIFLIVNFSSWNLVIQSVRICEGVIRLLFLCRRLGFSLPFCLLCCLFLYQPLESVYTGGAYWPAYFT